MVYLQLNNDLFQQHGWLGEEYEKLGSDQSSYAAVIRDTDFAACKAKLDRKIAERNEKQRSVGSESNIDFDFINRQVPVFEGCQCFPLSARRC